MRVTEITGSRNYGAYGSLTDILLAGRNRLLLQSSDFKICLQLLKALIHCCRHIYPLRHDLHISDQLSRVAAVPIRCPFVLELPL